MPPQPGRFDESPRRRFRSISHEIAETLRDMILVGNLAPGQQVTQDELAQQLGVSTMPVREALLKLSHEGFIQGSRGRPFQVARTTPQDVADIYWMHARLASELTRRSCERADDETRQALREIHDRWTPAMRRNEPLLLESLNFQFHRLINKSAESPKLLLLLGHTLRFIPEHFYSLLPDWADRSHQGHADIVEAFLARDPDAAAAHAESHVELACNLLVTYFDESGVWTRPEDELPA